MLEKLIAPVTDLAGKFIKDKDKAAKLAHELATIADKHAQELAKGQLEINKEQAKHPSIFVAGARPAIMWVCALGLAWSFLLAPILNYFVVVFELVYEAPKIDKEGLLALTGSLLGLGGMRTYENKKEKPEKI